MAAPVLAALRDVAARLDAAHAERTRLIVAARADGYSYRQIGRAAGLSHARVIEICRPTAPIRVD